MDNFSSLPYKISRIVRKRERRKPSRHRLYRARIWDDSGAGAIDRLKFEEKVVDFEIIGLNAPSGRLLDSLSIP